MKIHADSPLDTSTLRKLPRNVEIFPFIEELVGHNREHGETPAVQLPASNPKS
jgi:hypothetical protein